MKARKTPMIVLATALALSSMVSAQETAGPVHFSRLVPLLPDKVDGFVAGKADGSTASMGAFKLTEVSRTYYKGSEDAAEHVTLKIIDGTGNPGFAAMHALPEFSSETTEGYEKGIKVDGYPAVEKYTTESKSGELTVIVDGRFLVSVNIEGFDSQALQAWWKKVDAKQLAALKAD
jgi:hypothetical protein